MQSGWLRETGRPIAQIAKDLGINEGALGNSVNATGAAVARMTGRWARMSGRAGPAAEGGRRLGDGRDVLKRSVALW